ncbi:hypothetical protein [Allorhizocola rhizosphaerae]|uniref:hypothetical protein n=1 Tax=Allorhizocola rhizosphaerae TaxID=1872709 RepID=UPI000E3BC4F3|nr:hypothetical protein [Allorhizocola rhizosphaerae]
MSTPDSDPELEIALAEYAHINELRNQIDQKSSNRFNFYLALVTAVIAVSAGLLPERPDDQTVLALAAIALLFGISIFARQVAFTSYSARLKASGNAIRVYLARRAPDLKPYLLLPVGADRGAFPARLSPFGGFAGTIGILNSAIVGFGFSLLIGNLLPGAIVFAAALTGHLVYVYDSRNATARAIAAIYEQRGLTSD